MNKKDFAIGSVLTAPSPSTTGTELTLQAGEGAEMPAVPFKANATPPNVIATRSNTEVILVTNVTVDTITFERAQNDTTAQPIAEGWLIVNAIYTDDLFRSSVVMGDSLAGTVDGVNAVFTTASPFQEIEVFKNGVRMREGATNDYTVTDINEITFTTAPATDTILVVNYITSNQVMIQGSNSLIVNETPTGTIDGANTTFTTAHDYIAGSLEVYVNGLKQQNGLHFTETTPSSGTFTMTDAPLAGDNLLVCYQHEQSVSGNADTVDGYHANATPTANQIPVLDGNGEMPIETHPATTIDWIDSGGTNVSITSTTLVDVTGVSTTFTNPYDVDVKLDLTMDFMAVESDTTRVDIFYTLAVDGVDKPERFGSLGESAGWVRFSPRYIIDVPAGATITLQARCRVSAADFVALWGRDSNDEAYRTNIVGSIVGAA